MDPTHRQLLDAVLADPDDDAPRRVLADWLVERDDPRGEFITLQCELAKPTGSIGRWRLDGVAAREQVLLAAHGPSWLAAAGLAAVEATFECGFVETVRIDSDRLAAIAPQLGGHEPVRRLAVRVASESTFVELLAAPLMARLVSLALDNNQLTTVTAQALAAARLPKLARLDLRNNSVGDAGVVALTTSPLLATVRHLELGSNKVGPRGAGALASCAHLAGLEQLELERNPLGDAGARALITSPYLTKLRRLNVSKSGLSDATTRAMTRRFGTVWVS